MRKLLDEISGHMRAFLAQREHLAMIVRCQSPDSMPLLKILEGLEQEDTPDLFWTCTEEFTDTYAYVNAVVSNFATKHEAVRLALQKKQMKPWPEVPAQITSEATPPAERLRALAAFSRELFPIRNAGNAVWIFFPTEIANGPAYAALMQEALRHEFPFPWCHHIRFVIREDAANPALANVLGQAPRILWYQPDLSPEAVNRSFEAEIADESLTLAERMAPLPIMAGNDFAMGRYPDALAKYELLLSYHASNKNYAMAAFALNGMGEVYERTGDLARANESYEAALIPASEGDAPPIPILLNVVMNLGNLRFREQKWADAEAYYDMAQQLATAARNAAAKMRALEMRGYCQQQQGRAQDVVESWRSGAIIAAQLEDVSSCRTFLGRLEQYYTAPGQTAVADALRQQIMAMN